MSSTGSVVAVGAIGYVKVYTLTAGEWIQRGAKLVGAGLRFGWHVALSGNGTVLAVGDPSYHNSNGRNAGLVQAFSWNGTAWTEMGSPIDGESYRENFGYAVSLSNDGTVLAASAYKSNEAGEDAGKVRIFAWGGEEWLQRGAALLGEAAGDQFGTSVSLSSNGMILACGAYRNDGNGFSDSGNVRVFYWTGTSWDQLGTTIYGQGANFWFGIASSLSGNGKFVAVGGEVNRCWVFRFDGTDWVQIGQTLTGEAFGDKFGRSMALSANGDTLIVGGHLNDGNGLDSGHARVFRLSPNNNWDSLGQDLYGEYPGDEFGFSVAVSSGGSRVAVGGRYNDANGRMSGHVRIFQLT